MNILVIAPHPDDEVLGCGGTIKKHATSGDRVYVCFGTKAYEPEWSKEFIANRPKEIEKASQILGITKSYFLDFPTVKTDTFPQKEINDAILKVLKEVQPEILYIPHGGDLNLDHKIFFESTLVAARPLPGSTVKKIYSYEVLSETEWGGTFKSFLPNVYINITQELEAKKEAMKAYESELKEFPHPRSLEGIDILAKKRGSEVGFLAAESFMLIREIM